MGIQVSKIQEYLTPLQPQGDGSNHGYEPKKSSQEDKGKVTFHCYQWFVLAEVKLIKLIKMNRSNIITEKV